MVPVPSPHSQTPRSFPTVPSAAAAPPMVPRVAPDACVISPGTKPTTVRSSPVPNKNSPPPPTTPSPPTTSIFVHVPAFCAPAFSFAMKVVGGAGLFGATTGSPHQEFEIACGRPTSRPHLSISVPQTGHIVPPHRAWCKDVGRRTIGNVVLPHLEQRSGSKLMPQRFLTTVP